MKQRESMPFFNPLVEDLGKLQEYECRLIFLTNVQPWEQWTYI